MFERLQVVNFKAIGPAALEMELAPLTILVGPNGSGKSSAMEALALLAQSVRPINRVGWVTEGSVVDLGKEVGDLFHGLNTQQELKVTFWWRASDREELVAYSFGVRKTDRWGEYSQALQRSDGSGIRFSRRNVGPGAYQHVALVSDDHYKGEVIVGGALDRFLDPALFGTAGPKEAQEAMAVWRDRADRLAEFLSDERQFVRYLSALRGAYLISRETEGTGRPSSWAGYRGQHTARLLNRFQLTRNSADRDLLGSIAGAFGLADIRTGSAGGGYLAIRFQDPATGADLPIDDAAQGSQQSLPVLADLIEAPEGSTILIEEVERSCHPDWVREWGLLLAGVAGKRGVQVVASTHSPDLVMSVAIAVRKGILHSGNVAVHQFFRDQSGNVTTERSAVDEHGLFRDGWLETFRKAELRLMDELMGDKEPISE